MSYTSLIYHIVFSTKERRALISDDVRPRLCEYLAGMIKTLAGMPIEINAPADHVHIVASLGTTISFSNILRDVKSHCTGWIHNEFPDLQTFSWQEGYSAFSVSPTILPKVVRYVRDQLEHHKKIDFTTELKWLLDGHGIEYDDRYL